MSEKMKLDALSDDALEAVSGGYLGGQTLASGSFASNSGTQLNIQVNWAVRTDTVGNRTLDATVYCNSYSLYSVSIYNGVSLTVNGVTYSSTSSAISYDGRSMISTPLASFSIPNQPGYLQMTAVWHFNGTYSGVPIGDIVASGAASV